MKIFFIVLTFLFFISTAFSNSSDGVFGYWMSYNLKSKKPEAIVLIYEKNNYLYGKVVRLLPERIKELKEMGEYPPLCKKCPDDFKDNPMIGLNFIYGLKKSGDIWEGGNILDPETGKIYKVKIWVDKEDPDTLIVRGYVGPFYRTQRWKRVITEKEK